MPSGVVLAFDTSAAHCAAALLSGDRVRLRFEPMDKGQAERLMPLLAELLAEAGLRWSDLTAIGVGTGPGNATGIRISVAAARGLALGLGIPAIGVTCLEAAALDVDGPVAVVEDARRGAVYVQVFAPEPGPAQMVALDRLADILGPHPLTGGMALAASDLTGGRVVPSRLPLAEAIARIARLRSGRPQPRPAPFYLRGADATPPSDPPLVILP